MSYKHSTYIGLGGTFDHLHDGHKKFLQFAAELGHPLKIGISAPDMLKGKTFAQQIQPWSIRARHVNNFLQQLDVRFDIFRLHDAVGPTLEDTSIVGLAVTEETVDGARYINDLRDKVGLRQLETFVCELVMADDGQPIHSSRIRQGLISSTGRVYADALKEDVTLSTSQRDFFSQAQGKIVTAPTRKNWTPLTAVVGDISLDTFISENWDFDLGIYDLSSSRQDDTRLQSLKPTHTTPNPAGSISTQLVTTINDALTNLPATIQVTGEEDLATVALVLQLPLYSRVYYGQPNQGIVELKLTPRLKDTFYEALSNE